MTRWLFSGKSNPFLFDLHNHSADPRSAVLNAQSLEHVTVVFKPDLNRINFKKKISELHKQPFSVILCAPYYFCITESNHECPDSM